MVSKESVQDFHCSTTKGEFSFHSFLTGDLEAPFTLLFTHPADFTPVCTTEIGMTEKLVRSGEFKKRGVKVIGLSCDSVDDHVKWGEDVLAREKKAGLCGGEGLSFPLIADPTRQIVTMMGMLDPEEIGSAGLPMPARSVFVFGPDKKLKLSILYPATTGRSYQEILRALDSLLLTSKFPFATPVEWRAGERVIVAPNVKPEEASKFPGLEIEDLPSGKQYLRSVDQPEIPYSV